MSDDLDNLLDLNITNLKVFLNDDGSKEYIITCCDHHDI